MRDAFKAVKRNRGAAGVDKVSIQMFGANQMDNLHALMRQLKDGSYEPLPLRRVYIPKNRDPWASPWSKTESLRKSSVGSWTRSSDLSSILLPSALSRAATATWRSAMLCSCTPRVLKSFWMQISRASSITSRTRLSFKPFEIRWQMVKCSTSSNAFSAAECLKTDGSWRPPRARHKAE